MSDEKFVRNRPPSYGEFAERPFPGSPDDMMDTIAALRAKVAKLEAALKDIAKQMMSDEMDQDQRDNAHWQFGYNTCVENARAALSETVEA